METLNQVSSHSRVWKEQEILFLWFALERTQAKSGETSSYLLFIVNKMEIIIDVISFALLELIGCIM